MITTFEQVSKTYGHVTALSDFNLTLRPGELTALLGPNGAGKSTAIGLLLGLSAPSAGRVRVLGADPRQSAVRARIGAMPQESALPGGLTVCEAVTLFASFYPAPLGVDEALALADLGPVAGRRAAQLSGGQKRRLAFALAVVGDPELLLIDEPTTGMDAQSRAAFWEAVTGLRARGRTILLTTHYLEEAERTADRVVVMNGGRVLADDTPQGLRAGVGGAQVSFVSALAQAELERLPGVSAVQVGAAGRAELRTSSPEALLAALIGSGTAFSELEVTRATLEEAYLQLTGPHDLTPVTPGA